MDNKYRTQFNQMKKERREKKRCEKRSITGEEVIFIFEKFIEGWSTIRIYNTIIQNDNNSSVDKKKVETKKSIKDVMQKSHSSGEFDHDYFEQQRKLHEKLQKENDRLARR